MTNKNRARKTALFGMLAALALALSYLESLLPPLLPVPGIKPGFSNIATMFAVSTLGGTYGLAITLFKAFFALITRGATASFMSASGGLLSLCAMALLFKIRQDRLSFVAIGVICAVMHNIGQLICAFFILGRSMLALSPVLIAAGAVTGVLTGTVFKLTSEALSKQANSYIKPAGAPPANKE